VLVGNHPGFRDRVIHRLRELAVPEAWRDMNAEMVWAADAPEPGVAETAATPPFGSPRRFLLVRGLEAYRMSGGAAEGEPAPGAKAKRRRAKKAGDAAPLLDYCRTPSPSTVLVLTCEEWDAVRFAKDELASVAAETGEIVDCAPPQREALPAWLVAEATAAGAAMDPAAAAELVDRAGQDATRLMRELEKLICYAGPGAAIGVEDVVAMTGKPVAPEVFDFLDALFVDRRPARALPLLDRLLADDHPLSLHALMIMQLRKLIALKSAVAAGLSKWQIASQVRLPPHLVDRLVMVVSRTSFVRFAELLRALATAETSLKRGGEGRAVLESLVFEVCRSG